MAQRLIPACGYSRASVSCRSPDSFSTLYDRADHPLIDVRLFKNRVVILANSEMLLLGVALFNILLPISIYLLQQVQRQTPAQSGLHLTRQGRGVSGHAPSRSRHGQIRPRKVVLAQYNVELIGENLAIVAYGSAGQADYLPTLLAGRTFMGMVRGYSITLLAGAEVQTCAPHQITWGSTLVSISRQATG